MCFLKEQLAASVEAAIHAKVKDPNNQFYEVYMPDQSSDSRLRAKQRTNKVCFAGACVRVAAVWLILKIDNDFRWFQSAKVNSQRKED